MAALTTVMFASPAHAARARFESAAQPSAAQPSAAQPSAAQVDSQCVASAAVEASATRSAATRPTADDPGYVAAVREACTYSTQGDVSAPQTLGPDDLPASAQQLAASDGTTLAAAAATWPVYTETWWQTATGCCWRERNHGRIYFDYHGHVWSTTQTYGYLGWHHCDMDYGYGYSISHDHCFTERRWDLWGAGGHPISEWDRYTVHAFYKGFPIATSHTMHANAYANGNIYYH